MILILVSSPALACQILLQLPIKIEYVFVDTYSEHRLIEILHDSSGLNTH
jgi:hypothetical protein